MTKSLTILGASTRAAAYSARAAGFVTRCADWFADVDLQAVSAVERIEDYPHGFAPYLHASPPAPWMYTGALENHPQLIDELAQLRPLYGNAGLALRRARDPLFWSRALADSGLPSPRVSLSAAELPGDGSWLRKPLASAGGRGISHWTRNLFAARDSANNDWYFQERIEGIPIAAVFVAADGEAAILGVSQQLVGDDWRAALSAMSDESHPPRANANRNSSAFAGCRFRYTGSLGPYLLAEEHYHTIARIGGILARECGLVGLFGVDAIVNQHNVWPVEINPRYTASIEVLERASALRTQARRPRRLLAIEWHEMACCFRQLPAPVGQSSEAISGKLIYYAPQNGRFSPDASRWAAERNLVQSLPAVADIPPAGSPIRQGQPVLTLLAEGPSLSTVRSELTRAAEEFERLL